MAHDEFAPAVRSPATDANVFICRPETICDPALLRSYELLLDERERLQLSRFRFRQDAHTFLVTHALVRVALSEFGGIDPREWKFKANEFGRPEVESPKTELRFSLTHCNHLVACIVTAGSEPGIDAEEIRDTGDLLDLGTRYFSLSESAALRACSKEMMLKRFFSLWTLKEAYSKARGLGLSLPLSEYSFDLGGQFIVLRCSRESDRFSSEWTFTLTRPTARHVLATAVHHRPDGVRRRAVYRDFVPLMDNGREHEWVMIEPEMTSG